MNPFLKILEIIEEFKKHLDYGSQKFELYLVRDIIFRLSFYLTMRDFVKTFYIFLGSFTHKGEWFTGCSSLCQIFLFISTTVTTYSYL